MGFSDHQFWKNLVGEGLGEKGGQRCKRGRGWVGEGCGREGGASHNFMGGRGEGLGGDWEGILLVKVFFQGVGGMTPRPSPKSCVPLRLPHLYLHLKAQVKGKP